MSKNSYPQEFLDLINPIITNKEFLKRKKYMHHGNKSVFEHSIKVAYLSYRISKKLHANYKDATIAALLHDFYYKPWQTLEKRPLFKKHGFVHGKEAANNSLKFFPEYVNKKIIDSIEKHMFPLTIKPPKYKEGWIVTLSDKIESMDVLFHPSILLSFFKKA